MTQADAVAIAMKENGGYATLGLLFQTAVKVPGIKWATKTPNATIRRIVQQDKRFFKIRPGLWALTEYRDRIPFLEAASAPANSERQSEFSHGYYQGLLVEIGAMRTMQTFVPAQDKNRKFLDRKLSELVSLSALPSFGYDWVLQKAKYVDVVWLNERNMPSSFMEVEHSTNMQSALLKFFSLQDFYSDFRIVAPQNRQRDFKAKIGNHAFREIRERVKFASYEQVESMHTALGALNALHGLL